MLTPQIEQRLQEKIIKVDKSLVSWMKTNYPKEFSGSKFIKSRLAEAARSLKVLSVDDVREILQEALEEKERIIEDIKNDCAIVIDLEQKNSKHRVKKAVDEVCVEIEYSDWKKHLDFLWRLSDSPRSEQGKWKFEWTATSFLLHEKKILRLKNMPEFEPSPEALGAEEKREGYCTCPIDNNSAPPCSFCKRQSDCTKEEPVPEGTCNHCGAKLRCGNCNWPLNEATVKESLSVGKENLPTEEGENWREELKMQMQTAIFSIREKVKEKALISPESKECIAWMEAQIFMEGLIQHISIGAESLLASQALRHEKEIEKLKTNLQEQFWQKAEMTSYGDESGQFDVWHISKKALNEIFF